MEKEALTYEDIREIQRKERESSKLQKVDEDFYARLYRYLNDKEKLLEKEGASEDFKRRRRRELANARRTIKDIVSIREQKIALHALQSLKTEKTRRLNITPKELKLFKGVLSAFKKFEEEIKSSKRIKKEEGKEKRGKEEKIKYKIVRILEDTPAFVGDDLKRYGPAKKGDVMTLPPGVAKTLINQGKAKEIEVK